MSGCGVEDAIHRDCDEVICTSLEGICRSIIAF
jgi:hypothetical protein